jgi:putative hydrolase of the HAD superfamily
MSTNQPTIRYVLFDLGNVLIELQSGDMLRSLFPDQPHLQKMEYWGAMPCIDAVEKGQISTDEFCREAIRTMDIDLTPQRFADLFRGWIKGTHDEAESWIAELRTQVGVGCLSNTSAIHREHIDAQTNLLRCMDHVFTSYELGLRKPDPQIYTTVLQRLPVAPGEILFLDDRPDNVASARETGMQAEEVFGLTAAREAVNRYL